MKVKWEYQKPNKTKLTQCYNCQMYGHGSNRCMVKTFCAQCAGNHKTSDCKETVVKCANCKGPHKAMSLECPSRQNYNQIRMRAQPRNTRTISQQFNNGTNYNANFPNALNQNQMPSTQITGNNQINYQNMNGNNKNNNLFSFEEIKNLTFELIASFKNCKSREEQFGVVTTLAFKFLYQ